MGSVATSKSSCASESHALAFHHKGSAEPVESSLPCSWQTLAPLHAGTRLATSSCRTPRARSLRGSYEEGSVSSVVLVGSCRRLISSSSTMLVRTLASSILTVVVLCDRFRHTRDNSLLHTPLIDAPWLLLSSSQDERSVLTRRALLSVSTQTRVSFWIFDDLVTPRLLNLAAKLAALGHSGQALG